MSIHSTSDSPAAPTTGRGGAGATTIPGTLFTDPTPAERLERAATALTAHGNRCAGDRPLITRFGAMSVLPRSAKVAARVAQFGIRVLILAPGSFRRSSLCPRASVPVPGPLGGVTARAAVLSCGVQVVLD